MDDGLVVICFEFNLIFDLGAFSPIHDSRFNGIICYLYLVSVVFAVDLFRFGCYLASTVILVSESGFLGDLGCGFSLISLIRFFGFPFENW